MLAHGFAITYLPQKLEEHHQTTERSDRSLRLAQFHFFSAPKSGNFPMHCFVLLGVSFIQLKLNRVRAKQCYSISEFRLIPYKDAQVLNFYCDRPMRRRRSSNRGSERMSLKNGSALR